jgi:hypothetical protein
MTTNGTGAHGRKPGGKAMKRPRDPLLLRRQRYRLRATVTLNSLTVCPEWLCQDGVYEGDIDPSSQDFHALRIRLFNPRDPELTLLLDESVLEEVD